MRTQRWVYVLIIVIGVLLGLAIAGAPSRHYDPPLRISPSTSTTVSGTPPQT